MKDIPLPVPRDLGEPVGCVVAAAELFLKNGPVAAVPEIPVAEDDYPRRPENDIRVAQQVAGMFPVSQAHRPERAAQ